LFKIFANAWRVEDIRKKLLFIFLLLLIYRFGSAIPLPGINLELLYQARHGLGGMQTDALQTIFSMIAGGGLGSVFVMGIAPYITSSIIMQLLTYAIPDVKKFSKSHAILLLRLPRFKRREWCFLTRVISRTCLATL
jgi:preprotein translocase subunit SecY